MLEKVLRVLFMPVSWFFRRLGMPLEGGCAIDLNDPYEWMDPADFAAIPGEVARFDAVCPCECHDNNSKMKCTPCCPPEFMSRERVLEKRNWREA